MDGTARKLTSREYAEEAPTRRITVYFDGPTPADALILEYAATRAEAWEFTSAAVHAGLVVTVDSKVRPELRPLPCRSLWH
ncbi:hypothetical protein ACFQZZ_05180 [Nocardia sp. GCM10030253]|uniref:hypothetical protein n=1 Tax=Nocardia sp. GCM10030253 TaxID=3273404 RepID=UPI003642A83E